MSREEVMKLRYTGSIIDPPRKPNEKEIHQFIISKLKYYHLKDPVMVDTVTYRSLKGMIKKGDIDNPLTYIRKYVDENFDEELAKYKETNSILEAHSSFIPSISVPVHAVTLNLNNGGNNNDNSKK